MKHGLLLLVLSALGCSSSPSSEPGKEDVDVVWGQDTAGPSNPTNSPPVLQKVGNKEVLVGQQLVVVLTAEDPDGDELTFSVYGDLPKEARFIKDEATLEWTPTQAGGPFFVTLVVSDKREFDSETIELTAVEAGQAHAPVFEEVGQQYLQPEVPYELVVQASDVDGGPLTYSVDGALPSGATFEADSHTLFWTPTQADAGVQVPVTFVVSDGALTDWMEVLFVVQEAPTTCQNDTYEPNNSQGQATKLSGEALQGTPLDSLMICPGDTDVYRVALECGDLLYASVELDGAAGDLDMTLIRALDDVQVDSASGPGSYETVGLEGATVPGDYLIQVYGVPKATTEISYTLEVLLESAGPCLADELEPNDTQMDALPLMDKDYLDGLNLCCDQDWYEITPTSGNATVTVTGAQGALSPALVKAGGETTPLACTAGECVATAVLSTSPLYLVVDGLYGATYTLELKVDSGTTSGSCVGKCGGESGGCWCDDTCLDNGDCCPDACAVCGVC